MGLIMMLLLPLCRIILMFGRMVVWFLIILLVSPLPVRGFLLIKLSVPGEVVCGVMLMIFVLILIVFAAVVFVRFLDHFNLFRGLSYGVLL